MAGCKEDDFINVLVLGSSNIKISQFLKLFAAYLKYDTSKEVMFYEPNLKTEEQNVTETRSYITEIQGHNFHFIDTPGLQKSYRSYKEICDILLHFKATSRVHAIILLIEPDRKGSENYFEQYTAHFLYGLKQFARNLLYVVLNNDSCMFDRTYRNFQKAMDTIRINALVPQKSNVFHLHEDTFFTVDDNWEESVNFCRDVFDYITGSDLNSFYLQCVTPREESFMNLIYYLMDLLFEAYYFAEFYFLHNNFYYISDYEKNVTVCYGNNCIKFKMMKNGVHLKVPKVCHESCRCTETSFDVGNCTIFDAEKKNCSVCNCDRAFHNRIMFDKEFSESTLNAQHEKSIIISTLAQLFYFIKSYGCNPPSIKELIAKFSNQKQGCLDYEVIMEKLTYDCETELKTYSKSQITVEKLLLCIYRLYEVNEVATIIPKLINENLPEGLRLEVITRPQKQRVSESRTVRSLRSENQSIKVECQSVKVENENMRRELDELKQRLDQILNCCGENNLSSNHFKVENVDNFNIKEINEEHNL